MQQGFDRARANQNLVAPPPPTCHLTLVTTRKTCKHLTHVMRKTHDMRQVHSSLSVCFNSGKTGGWALGGFARGLHPNCAHNFQTLPPCNLRNFVPASSDDLGSRLFRLWSLLRVGATRHLSFPSLVHRRGSFHHHLHAEGRRHVQVYPCTS